MEFCDGLFSTGAWFNVCAYVNMYDDDNWPAGYMNMYIILVAYCIYP